MSHPDRNKNKKQPAEHWLKAKNQEDCVRLMIIEGYTAKEIELYTNTEEEFIINIAEKFELHVRHKCDGPDKSYWDFVTNNDRRW